jgi:dTMP kinase
METRKPEVLERFIVLEGGDGAGTTTQLKILDAALDRARVPHWTTCEPTDREEGALIRSILSGSLVRDPGTLARLFAADRGEHLYGKGGIVERLGRGEAVVCDRYVLSSLAYQGAACGPELPWSLNSGFPLPSLLLYFDVSPELSLDRIRGRESREIYEVLHFQELVRAAYAQAIERLSDSPMKVVRVDASLPRDLVTEQVLGSVGRELGLALAAPAGA